MNEDYMFQTLCNNFEQTLNTNPTFNILEK